MLAGVALVLIAAHDMVGVVLATRALGGIVSPFANRVIWTIGRWLDTRLGLDGRLMELVGPTLLVLVVVIWAVLFITGFALIYQPMLGEQIQASSGTLEADWITALYFSGFNFATLGIGDIVPVSDVARLLTVLEACTGFAVFTLGVSYTLNIYQAVNQRDAFALSLHGGTGETGRVEIALLGLCPDGRPAADSGTVLGEIADKAYALLQAHHAYPIAHYFRRRKIELAMSRIAVQVLDLVTLTEAALERDANLQLLGSRGYINAKHAGLRLVHTTREMTDHGSASTAPPDTAAWTTHFNTAYTLLANNGVTLRPQDVALTEYLELRLAWENDTRALAETLGHDWSAVSSGR